MLYLVRAATEARGVDLIAEAILIIILYTISCFQEIRNAITTGVDVLGEI
jgi:hypothetical protein